MTSAWFRILKDYGNNFGPTIPFTLGALRQPVGQILPDDESLGQLRALLVTLRDDAPDGYRVAFRGCPNLREPVLWLPSVEPVGALKFDSLTKGRALYFEPFYGLVVNDFESLVEGLWDRYRAVIAAGNFSCRNSTWQAFDETELARLKERCDIA